MLPNMAHRIEYKAYRTNNICSATSVGPHVLLTASHCESPTTFITVDGVENIKIKTIGRDGRDHSFLYLTKDVLFPDIADIYTGKVEQGQAVFMTGNPDGLYMMRRVGYFMGVDNKTPEDPEMLFDLNVYYGDSGAGIFDKATGKLIGVMSFMRVGDNNSITYKYASSSIVVFKDKDYENARKY